MVDKVTDEDFEDIDLDDIDLDDIDLDYFDEDLEEEELDEISKDLAKHYINTADMDMEFRDDDITRTARSGQSTRDLRRKNSKRLTKTYLAKAKLGQHDSRKARVSATEELEIEEEKKASFGVNASIPDPVTKGSTKRPQDNTQGDKSPPLQGNLPKTKTEMLSLTMAKLSSMPKTELTAAYKTLMNPTKGEGVIMQGSSKLREALEVSAVDFDLSEDIDALFNGVEDISEDFKTKAVTIFEAAVTAKVNERLNALQEQVDDLYESLVAEVEEEIVEKVDSYLDYVVAEWVETNALSIDAGIRTEIAEDFMVGLKKLFQENYVDIPDERIDVLEDLSDQVDELEEQINAEVAKNMALEEELEVLKAELLIKEATEDMNIVDAEKLRELASGIDFVNEEDFADKLDILKESYFVSEETTDKTRSSIFDETEELSEEVEVPANMKQYVSVISRTSAKS